MLLLSLKLLSYLIEIVRSVPCRLSSPDALHSLIPHVVAKKWTRHMLHAGTMGPLSRAVTS